MKRNKKGLSKLAKGGIGAGAVGAVGALAVGGYTLWKKVKAAKEVVEEMTE